MTPPGSLRDELKQTRPFRSLGQETALALLRTADVVRRRFAGVVEARGVTAQQYNVLRILRGAGTAGLPTLEIGARMIERTPGVTRLIDRLERAGLVARRRSSADRRTVLCRATDRGLAVLADLDDPVAAADDEVLSMLSPAEQRELLRLLDAVRAHTPDPPSGAARRSRKESP